MVLERLKLIFIILNCLIILSSCNPSWIYHDIFVDKQVKELTQNILDKKVTINYLGQTYNRYLAMEIKGMPESQIPKAAERNVLQRRIDSMKKEDIVKITYSYYTVNSTKPLHSGYHVTIYHYWRGKIKRLVLDFCKRGDDDYYLIDEGVPYEDLEDDERSDKDGNLH